MKQSVCRYIAFMHQPTFLYIVFVILLAGVAQFKQAVN